MNLININELEATQALHSNFRTDLEEWNRAMLRLRTIHLNNSNPLAAHSAVKYYRARLGLALPDSQVSYDTLRNYGYGLLLDSHGYTDAVSKGSKGS